MSVRPVQVDDVRAAAEAASRFTLRGVVTDLKPPQLAMQQQQMQQTQQKTTSLKFSIGNHPLLTPAPQTTQAAPQKPMFRGVPKTESTEIMRLSAYVDDLSKRLKDTSAKLKVHETALARSNQALVAERHAAQQKLSSMKKDIDIAHETEAKLRAEISAINAKEQVTRENKDFLSTVRSAIATEAIEESKLSEARALEARLDAMKDEQLQLEAHLASLTMDKSAAERELAAAEEVVVATQEKSMRLTEQMAMQEERLVAINKIAPDAAPQPQVADLLMMEEAAVSGEGGESGESGEVSCCYEPYVEYKEPQDEKPPELKISGAAPVRAACPLAASVRKIANYKLPGAYVGAHFNLDAPADLTAATAATATADTAGAPDDNMTGLVNAIVEDIRAVLEHAQSEIFNLENFAQDPDPLL